MIPVMMLMLPLAGAIAAPIAGLRKPSTREALLRLFTMAELVLAAWIFIRVLQGEEIAFSVPGVAGLGLSFRVDGFRALYALLACFMWAMACQFSLQYFAGHGSHQGRYTCFTLITQCGVIGVFFSDDLYTAFVFFEIMSIASYPWVAHEENRGAMRAAATYLGVSVACGMVTLMGMFMCWKEVGSLSFDVLRSAGGNPATVLPACLMLVGYAAKAGMVPLHIWLPKAHPVAPAPASALLSGMLTKTGIFGVAVIAMNLLGDNELFGQVLLAIGLVTMTLGAVLGVFSVNLKRTLACSSLSQIGYITVGLSCALLLGHHGSLAAAGTVGHMVNHSLLKLCLFLCAGAVYMKTHTLDLNELRGYGHGKTLLHIVFLLGALGLMGVPGLNGYTGKTMIHEGLVELAEEIGSFSIYRLCEWIFLFAAGLTTAYMLKLYICLFWQKNPDLERQTRYDMMNGRDLTARSAAVLALSAVPIVALGILPNRLLLPMTKVCAGFFNRPALSGEVAFFSWTNLMGGGISLIIGGIVYLLFVRKVLYDPEKGYVNRWPERLDLEALFYRPVFTRFLPWVGCGIASFLDGIPQSRLITEWFPKGVTAIVAGMDRLPDSSRIVTKWIPKGVTAVVTGMDRLPESKVVTKIVPGIFVAFGRISDELADHIALFGREFFLQSREDLQNSRDHNGITRLVWELDKDFHRIGLLPGRIIRSRAPDDLRYGTWLTNAISFGLLLGTAGIVAAILYVFIRMGV